MSVETYKALIDTVITERSQELGTKDLSEAFENVANTLILEPYDLGVDEIDAGITDGGGDGQIDSMYVIVNGAPLSDIADSEIPEKGPLEVDIVIIQAKNTDSFEENPLRIIRTTVNDLINLNNSYKDSFPNYNEAIQEKFALARKALLSSAGRTARIRVRIYYATKAGTANIHANVHAAANALKAEVANLAATPDVDVTFIGSQELISRSRQPKTRKRELAVEDLLSSDSGDSFACLVSIGSLISFLSDDKGELVRALFDANVRDFLGKTEVNDAIRSTLESMSGEDFWWFNNGVTIVAAEVDQKGKKLVLSEALLVNGLQTSNVLYAFMSDLSIDPDLRERRRKQNVLVKIIVPTNESVRDEIVKATNSQTHIPKPYLRGMDLVHRNIEDHFKSFALYYERRKNQYRNAGKSRSSIITLTEMAQALMAALLFRGDKARGQPNSLLKSDEDYQSLFSDKFHLDVFKNVIIAKRAVMAQLVEIYQDRGAAFRNDVIYHILAFLGESSFFTQEHAAKGWQNLTFRESELKRNIELVVKMFDDAGGTDRIAKSGSFRKIVSDEAIKVRQEKVQLKVSIEKAS